MQRHSSCLVPGTCFVYDEGRTYLVYLQEITAPLSNYQILVAEVEPGSHKTYVIFLEEKVSVMLWATPEAADQMLAELLESYTDDVPISNPVTQMLAYGTVTRAGAFVAWPLPNKVLQ